MRSDCQLRQGGSLEDYEQALAEYASAGGPKHRPFRVSDAFWRMIGQARSAADKEEEYILLRDCVALTGQMNCREWTISPRRLATQKCLDDLNAQEPSFASGLAERESDLYASLCE